MAKPPQLFNRLLQWYCRQTEMEDIQGDFYEVYYDRAEDSKTKANWLFALDTLKLFTPFSKQRKRQTWLSESYNFNFRNQIRRSVRNLRKYPFINTLKIVGLGIAASAFFFIHDYAQFHHTFDRFHEKKDRIYRVVTTVNSADFQDVTAWSHYYLKDLEDEFPEIEAMVRLLKVEQGLIIKAENQFYTETEVFYSDPEFSEIFGYKWIEGSPLEALEDPESVIVTESTAEKYFGLTKGLIGKVIEINDETYQINGVIENLPSNSDLSFDLLLPFPYENFEDWMFVYVLLHEKTSVAALEAKFEEVLVDYNTDYTEDEITLDYSFENIKDIHYSEPKLYDTPKMDSNRILLFQLLGWIILIIALVNYINLYSTQLLHRVRSVNVQMVVGASKKQLMLEFLTEASLYYGLSLACAILITYLAKDFISFHAKFSFFSVQLSFSSLLILGISFFILVFVTALHALILTTSRKNSQLFETKTMKAPFRKALIGVQFALSFGIILSTIVIFNQTSLIQNQPLGFNSQNTIHFQFPVNMNGREIRLLQEALKGLDFIESISTMEPNSVPGMTPWVEDYYVDDSDNTKLFEELGVDENYLETLQLDLLYGDFFIKGRHRYNQTFVVNKAFVNHMGWNDEEAINKKLQVYHSRGPIVGVINNFYFNSPHDLIQPMIIRYFSAGRSVIVKFHPKTGIKQSIYKIESVWKAHIPDLPFNFSFLDSDYKKQFEEEHATLDVLGIIAGLVILLSVLGMYAILLMLVKAREKELGIRKVNGANRNDLFKLFSIDFIKILLLGIGCSVPLFGFGISSWLEKYPLRISLSPLYFVATAMLILLIACFVIYVQASRAYQANTIDALKYE
ncbi:MAG: ABC transporter permease [Bacteroidota bacterium]